MRIVFYYFKTAYVRLIFNQIYLISVILCVACFFTFSCSIQSKLPVAGKSILTGNIHGIGADDTNFNFRVETDSSLSARVRLYTTLGIKLADIFLYHDSIQIVYIIDDSYKNAIYGFYRKLNDEICIHDFMNDFVSGRIYTNEGKSPFCYNFDLHENILTVSSRSYHVLFILEKTGNTKKHKMNLVGEYHLTLPNSSEYFIKMNR
jgi:hypothetical protein